MKEMQEMGLSARDRVEWREVLLQPYVPERTKRMTKSEIAVKYNVFVAKENSLPE